MKKTRNFLPLNMENKKFSISLKTGSFEGNRRFLRYGKQEIFHLIKNRKFLR